MPEQGVAKEVERDALTVAGLYIYPVKGCAGVPVERTKVTRTGLLHDRRFMVVDRKGVARTQRRTPYLAVVQPAVEDDRLVLRAPDVEPHVVGFTAGSARTTVTIFDTAHPAVDHGEQAASWLSEVLGAPSRLVSTSPEHHRPHPGETPGLSGWADSASLLVLSRSSVDMLSDYHQNRGGETVDLERFRTNVLLSSPTEPHLEERARRVRLGSAELGFTKLAKRCVVVNVNPSTGANEGPEPLRTLADYRRATGEGVILGAKFAVLTPGQVAVGDRFNVTDWGAAQR